MTLKDLIMSSLIHDTDLIRVTIHNDVIPMKDIRRGHWFEDGILGVTEMEIKHLEYDRKDGWKVWVKA